MFALTRTSNPRHYLFVTFAKILCPGGIRALAAESLLLKHQARRRAKVEAQTDQLRTDEMSVVRNNWCRVEDN